MFNSDTLDDPLVFDPCTSFSGGQVSNVRANLLTPTQLAQATNCDIAKQGQLVTRRGSERLGQAVGAATFGYPIGAVQGLTFYDTPDKQCLVAVAAGRIWYFDGSDWQVLTDGGTYSAADGARPINFAQGINLLYFADGAGPLYSWDGTTVTNLHGGAHPPPDGAKYLIWQESRLVLAGFPNEPDALYFSDFLAGDSYDLARGQLRVGAGEGGPIVALIAWTEADLVVFKRDSIWVVNCDPAQNTSTNIADAASVVQFSIKALTRRIGCVASRSVAQVGNDVFFLSADGVRSVRRSVATEQRAETGQTLSEPVRDVLDRITLSAIDTCAGTFWNNRYFLSLPLDGSLTPNYTLVYNIVTQSWSGLWTGWQPTDWTVSAVGGALRLCFGQSDGTVAQWLDYVQMENETDATYQDAGVDIPTTLKTRALVFSEPVSPKTGFNCEMEFNASVADVVAQVVLDDSDPVAMDTLSTASGHLTLPLTLPFVLPRAGIVRQALDLQRYDQFRELQFLLTTTAGKLALRSIIASAFVDTMEVQ